VFDTTGQFLYSFGCNGEGDGQFNAPTGIAIDPFDNILVGDWGNSRVQVMFLKQAIQSKGVQNPGVGS
jgi:tripartite motif-containing protein 2/3